MNEPQLSTETTEEWCERLIKKYGYDSYAFVQANNHAYPPPAVLRPEPPARSRTTTEPMTFDAALAAANRLAQLRADRPAQSEREKHFFNWPDEETQP